MTKDNRIPLSEPCLSGNEWRYIKECLDLNVVAAAGPFIERFERKVAEFVGAPHAVAVASGTAAIHLALRALDIGPTDAVIAPDFTFVAPINAIRYCGALPILLDVDRRTASLDPERVKDFLSKECERSSTGPRHRASGRRVKAILAVHLYGHPADLDPLAEIARNHEIVVLEDAAECLGAAYKGTRIGGRGDLACFSFNGNKVITSGAGGMVVARREEWTRRVRHLATQARAHPTEYLHDEIGFNYRMPSINAALGCAQMECLDEFLERKRRMAERYAAALTGIPGLTLMREESWARSSHWLTTVLVDPSQARIDAAALAGELRAQEIEARRVWPPVHAQTPYRDCPFTSAVNGDWLYAQALNLPSSVGLSDAGLDRVVGAVRNLLTGGRA